MVYVKGGALCIKYIAQFQRELSIAAAVLFLYK